MSLEMFGCILHTVMFGLLVLTKEGDTYEFQTTEITTQIRYHVAKTTMNIQLTNDENKTVEAKLYLMPPIEAFFTDLSMTIGNNRYDATLKMKKRAQNQMYDGTVLLETCEKWLEYDDSVYMLIVNVGSLTTANLKLTYQQVLEKVNGKYEYEVSVVGNKPTQMLAVNINICETRNIELKSVSAQNATVTLLRDEQNALTMKIENESGQFTNNGVARLKLTYKLDGDEEPEVLLGHGHFAYFGPELLYPPRMIMFVLQANYENSVYNDQRANEAMMDVLDSMTTKDRIGILKFGHKIKKWRKGKLSRATPRSIRSAKKFLLKDHKLYGTKYPDALELGVKLLKDAKKKVPIDPLFDFVVVFADGHTSSRSGRIVKNAWSYNRAGFGIHTLQYKSTFSSDALDILAGQNHGTFAKLYSKGFDFTAQFKQHVKKMDETTAGGQPLEVHYPGGVSDVISVKTPHGGVFTRVGKFNASSTDNGEPKFITLEAQMPNVSFNTAMKPKLFDVEMQYLRTCDSDIENMDEHPVRTMYRIAKLQEAIFNAKRAHYKELRRKTKKIASDLAYELKLVSPYTSLFLTTNSNEN
uniref:inter-alpha-trypsin inhibitor heavy chain H5-like isoform X2 n=1 Tax=Styela clava TaxID=7725 RepID=UPI00193A1D3D|nr:inter-alpha-trypsin inhibitor heavy chain H5-like isoform X2 [Styela clava]